MDEDRKDSGDLEEMLAIGYRMLVSVLAISQYQTSNIQYPVSNPVSIINN